MELGALAPSRHPELTSPPSTALLLTEVPDESNTVSNCEKATCKYKGLLCKIQEIPVLDVLLKLRMQYEGTYLQLELLVLDCQCLAIIII